MLRILGALSLIGAASGAVVEAAHPSTSKHHLTHSALASTLTPPSYFMVGADGQFYGFNAVNVGTPYTLGLTGLGGSHPLNAPIVGVAEDPSGNGYWMVAADGGVFNFGNAGFYGSTYSLGITGLTGSHPLNAPIVGIAATPDGGGYWLVAADGGIFPFGDASFYGNPYTLGLSGLSGPHPLNAPIVGIASSPDGGGYWLVAADGGVFNFGDAPFEGSVYSYGITGLTGSHPLNAPIVGIASSPGGTGYWLVGKDGGVFDFGSAVFQGSTYSDGITGLTGPHPLNAPIVGITATPDAGGYWLVAADGGVFNFGDAQYLGSMGGKALSAPVIGIQDPTFAGYDLSNYNCPTSTQSLPLPPQSLVIAEASGWPNQYDFSGIPTSGCFMQEIRLAGTQTQFYLYAGSQQGSLPPYPVGASPSIFSSGPLPGWTGSAYEPPSTNTNVSACALYANQPGRSCNSPGSNFTFGFNNAIFAYDAATVNSQAAGLPNNPNNPWWLDVEFGSSWGSDSTSNYHAILGSMAALQELGVSQVGIYSTNLQWSSITAGWSPTPSEQAPNGGEPLPSGTQLWMAAPGVAPGLVCSGNAGNNNDYAAFGGGSIAYVQYGTTYQFGSNGTDLNSLC
ncbi:MAG: glycoside hydrolase family 25 domain-containing protein [Ferrimicrobium sp.]